MNVRRFETNPIIDPKMNDRIGSNINGPSLIRVPDWLPNKLGKYYLYFAHHQGEYIRLAYADDLKGPWHVYTPGTLQLSQTSCIHHIASPDVHLDEQYRRIIMYYHGPIDVDTGVDTLDVDTGTDTFAKQEEILSRQRSFVAISSDGINFEARNEILAASYMRAFEWDGITYALSMPGIFQRSQDGLTNFKKGPILFDKDFRHSGLRLVGDALQVFFSKAHDCPEHILMSTVKLSDDWMTWKESEPISVLRPETSYEGGDLPPEPSRRGSIHKPVKQLRDPAIFEEDGHTYLLYSVAGEHGIAIAEIEK
jgi:hypothetical protein